MKNVAVIDYNVGNIRSVLKILDKIGVDANLTSDPATIENSSHLILPGVGHFATGMENLHKLNLVETIQKQSQHKPILGICLGMQLFFNKSEEAPGVSGLGLIDGDFKLFKIAEKVPHIGWNQIQGDNKPAIFSNIENGANFYFVHSYYAKLNENLPHTTTDYGIDFVSAISKGKIFGTQFHPEKSQKNGETLIRAFLDLC